MRESVRRRFYRASSLLSCVATVVVLAACAGPTPEVSQNSRSKEYFSERAYGVKASPRVTAKRSRLPRGGGREQVGQPYKVAGKWYYPKEYKRYSAVGAASWYGDAFHGRLTANGEIYDMTNLTAAHPTLPLPCYARVTNLNNGSSVIVRVNDRGPYAPGRIIDLSKRAADLLDYSRTGVAKVRVDYIGRAPLDGHDEQYLLASYRPGNGAPEENIATGVMVAMNGPTPSANVGSASFPGELDDSRTAAPQQDRPAAALAAIDSVTARPVAATVAMVGMSDAQDPVLPALGPVVPERPEYGTLATAADTLSVMSYADSRVKRAAQAFEALEGHSMTAADIVTSWKREKPGGAWNGDQAAYVSVGTFASREAAAGEAHNLSEFGRAEIDASELDGRTVYSVNLYPDGRAPIDAMLQEAWANGDTDAMTIRR